MFESITNFFKKFGKNDKENSSIAAKERLHLVLAQDRANISADFLEMMKQEIIDVIKKYIDIDEEAIDVRMTNKAGEDGIVGAPALYANIPIVTIKNEARKLEGILESKAQSISENVYKPNMDIQVNKNEDVESNYEAKNISNVNGDINIEQQGNKEETINVENVENSKQNIENKSDKNQNNEKSKTKNTSNKKQGQKTTSKTGNKKNSNTKTKKQTKKK